MTDAQNNAQAAVVESVVTIGNFDGVHLGHRRILAVARELADRVSAAVAAITFDPHPLTLLAPDRAPRFLMTLEQRIAALRAAGADVVLVLPVTKALLAQSPLEFIETIASRVRPLGFVEGNNFYFGRNRSGDSETLRQLGCELDFEVRIVEPVTVDFGDGRPHRICSSLIRRLLAEGRVDRAARCLGEPYRLTGRVVRGRGVGRRLGYPTANLDCGGQLIPADGIYAGSAIGRDFEHPAAIFIGPCSTFGQTHRVVEAYLPGDDGRPRAIGDIYETQLRLKLLGRLRDNQTFETTGQLQRAIADDVTRTLALAAEASAE